MRTSTRTSWRLRAGLWLLAAALVLPATAGSIGAACCAMESPCCPEIASDSERPILNGPVPGCCERVFATDRDAPADRRAAGSPAQLVAVIQAPLSPAPPAAVRTGVVPAPERCTDPPLSSRTGRSPPSSIA